MPSVVNTVRVFVYLEARRLVWWGHRACVGKEREVSLKGGGV